MIAYIRASSANPPWFYQTNARPHLDVDGGSQSWHGWNIWGLRMTRY